MAADSSSAMSARAVTHEYSTAAAVELSALPMRAFPASLHSSGPSRVVTLDLSAELGCTPFAATSPNLLASFVRILEGEAVATQARATSQAFYVIKGSGTTTPTPAPASSAPTSWAWAAGDLFVVPAAESGGSAGTSLLHSATTEASLYWISDEPLLKYLGVAPVEARFGATLYTRAQLLAAVEAVRHEPGAEHRNRMGVLLSSEALAETKTLSHVLWALLNVLPANTKQPPHRHNSVALDLAVEVRPESAGFVYTLMGPELDENGWVKNPTRMDWATGSMFTTPPGFWHSHHNESGAPAWVLPMQDAGLYTRQRTLDIRFSHAKPEPAGSGGR